MTGNRHAPTPDSRRQAARRHAGGARTLPAPVLHRPGATSNAELDALCSARCGSAPAGPRRSSGPASSSCATWPATASSSRAAPTGAVHAFHNVCRHRGTRLCTEATGQFAGSIQCPYHAWTYDLDGRLIGAPHMDEVPHFRKADYPLHRVHADEWDGHIFLNLDRRSPRRSRAQLGRSRRRSSAPWRMEDLRLGRRIVYDVQGQLEADHPELQRVPALPEPAPGAQQAVALPERRERAAARRPTWAAAWICVRASRRCRWTARARARSCRGCRPRIGGASTTTRSSRTCCSACTPTTCWCTRCGRSRRTARSTSASGTSSRPSSRARASTPSDAIEFWDMTNRQDWHVCELSQAGIASRAYTPGPYSNREDLLYAFDRMIVGLHSQRQPRTS